MAVDQIKIKTKSETDANGIYITFDDANVRYIIKPAVKTKVSNITASPGKNVLLKYFLKTSKYVFLTCETEPVLTS